MRVLSPESGSQSVLPGMEAYAAIYEPLVLDEGAILDGSNAAWGYRQGAVTGEVFMYRSGAGMTLLKVYPHDGEDHPIEIYAQDFSYSEEGLLLIIDTALKQRACEQ